MSNFLFKNRSGQTLVSKEQLCGLKIKNIQTVGELDEHEEANIAEGLLWLSKQEAGCWNKVLWCKLHKKLFGNVWSWAGCIRKTELQNPDFLLPYEVEAALYKLEDNLKYWQENKTYKSEAMAARLHEKLLTIHPFVNGNGRFSRILVEHFCDCGGVAAPTWGVTYKDTPDRRRNLYIKVVEEARHKKAFKGLQDFMYG